jgi:hypothetical protein
MVTFEAQLQRAYRDTNLSAREGVRGWVDVAAELQTNVLRKINEAGPEEWMTTQLFTVALGEVRAKDPLAVEALLVALLAQCVHETMALRPGPCREDCRPGQVGPRAPPRVVPRSLEDEVRYYVSIGVTSWDMVRDVRVRLCPVSAGGRVSEENKPLGGLAKRQALVGAQGVWDVRARAAADGIAAAVARAAQDLVQDRRRRVRARLEKDAECYPHLERRWLRTEEGKVHETTRQWEMAISPPPPKPDPSRVSQWLAKSTPEQVEPESERFERQYARLVAEFDREVQGRKADAKERAEATKKAQQRLWDPMEVSELAAEMRLHGEAGEGKGRPVGAGGPH